MDPVAHGAAATAKELRNFRHGEASCGGQEELGMERDAGWATLRQALEGTPVGGGELGDVQHGPSLAVAVGPRQA